MCLVFNKFTKQKRQFYPQLGQNSAQFAKNPAFRQVCGRMVFNDFYY